MEKIKTFCEEAVFFIFLFIIWAVCGLEVLDE